MPNQNTKTPKTKHHLCLYNIHITNSMYVPRLLQRISMGSFLFYSVCFFCFKIAAEVYPGAIRMYGLIRLYMNEKKKKKKKPVLDCDAITLSGNRNVCLFSNRIAFFSHAGKSTQNEGFKCTVIFFVLFFLS